MITHFRLISLVLKMVDAKLIANDQDSRTKQYDGMMTWTESKLSAVEKCVEQILAAQRNQKKIGSKKLGDTPSRIENLVSIKKNKLSDKTREWAMEVAKRYEAEKKKVGS